MEFTIIREHITSRGGGIEIDLTPHGVKGEKMTAYQNYLGGGMLGCICSDCTVSEWMLDDELLAISNKLKKHYAYLTCQEYNETQDRPVSAY